jgi:2-oxoglutarate ferredoxin oxidoreductase subunit beta
MRTGEATVVESNSVDPSAILVHDETRPNPAVAFSLSRLSHGPYGPTPLGVFRNVKRPTYDTEFNDQVTKAKEKMGEGDLAKLIKSQGTWTVSDPESNGSNGHK